jgi:hypothetical protein
MTPLLCLLLRLLFACATSSALDVRPDGSAHRVDFDDVIHVIDAPDSASTNTTLYGAAANAHWVHLHTPVRWSHTHVRVTYQNHTRVAHIRADALVTLILEHAVALDTPFTQVKLQWHNAHESTPPFHVLSFAESTRMIDQNGTHTAVMEHAHWTQSRTLQVVLMAVAGALACAMIVAACLVHRRRRQRHRVDNRQMLTQTDDSADVVHIATEPQSRGLF